MMNFDIVVIGDGVFGNVFLHELSKVVINSQNFSVAHIFTDEIAPACATRSTSTVSLNGIEKGISELGDDLYKSFLAFKNFYESEKISGIYPVKQIISGDNPEKLEKIKKRYKNNIQKMSSTYFNFNSECIELDSYIVIPELFFKDIKLREKKFNYQIINDIAIDIKEEESNVLIKLKNSEIIKAKKVVIATGAYSRIFTSLFKKTNFSEKIFATKIVAGSFLIKKFIYPNDLYFTLNGHNLVYRKETRELVIGSTTVQGAITAPNLIELQEIFNDMKRMVKIDLGEFSDYKIITGLRHKGQKRMPFFKSITNDSRIWLFNGAYKNGWSLPFYYVKRDIQQFI